MIQIQKFKKKPVVIEAVQFTNNNTNTNSENIQFITDWINSEKENTANHDNTNIFIQTLEGIMKASVGDYIIRGVNGEFYPCKEDIFLKTYDVVKPDDN